VDVVESEGGEFVNLKFRTAYMLPFLTVNSEYALYMIEDAEMTSMVATIQIEDHGSGDNIVKAKVLKSNSSIEDTLRAVEIHHESTTGDEKNYVKVYIDNDSGTEYMYELEDALNEVKKIMFENRKSFPVEVLPLTAFVMTVDEKDESDIVVSISDDDIVSVRNCEGKLVCPQVAVKSIEEAYLVTSYIASYSNWNMWHNISNPSTSLSPDGWLSMGDNSLKINIYGKNGDDYSRLITPKRVTDKEGYVYELEWNTNGKDGPETELFKIKFDSDFKEDLHIFLVELDLNYTIIQDPKYHQVVKAGENDEMVLIKKPIALPIDDIMMDQELGKWCRPYFEFKVFVSVDDETLSDGKLGNLFRDNKLSAGIKKAYYENVVKGEKDKFERESRESSDPVKREWAVIPIKIYVKELEKYCPS